MSHVASEARKAATSRPLRVSVAYAVLASAWILASDRLLDWLAYDAGTHSAYQTYKGWLFIAVTAGLLYFVLRRQPAPAPQATADATSSDAGLRRLLIGVLLLLVLCIFAALALNLWSARDARLAEAEQESRNLVRVIEAQTAASIDAADLALRELSRLLGAGAADARGVEGRMKEKLQFLPALRALIHVGADGRVRHESDPQPGMPTDLSARDYFRHHREHAGAELYVGGIIASRRTGGEIFSLSRRLSTPDGAFAGVVMASVDAPHIERLFASLETRHGRSITLARRDGVFLVRHPRADEASGRSYANSPLFAQYLPAAPSGTFRRVSEIDGIERIWSYRAVAERPLVVVLGLDTADVLAPWRKQAVAYASVAAAAALSFLWLGWLALREVGRRERLAADLRENEERFRALWQTSNDAVLILDRESRIRYANPAVRAIFGHAPEALLGQPLALLQPVRLAGPHAAAMKRYVETGRRTLDWRSVEMTALHQDGHEFPVEIAFSDHEVRGERLFAGFVRDITERKLAEQGVRSARERLQALSDQLLRVQENERASLARELHDEFGQSLTAMKLQLQMLAQGAPSAGLEDCIALADHVLGQVRTLSLELRPPQLDALGLEAALRAHTARLAQQTGRAIAFEASSPLPKLTGARAAACFRIAQEALTNMVRHSGPSGARVALGCGDGVLELVVSDDGAGFDVAQKRAGALKGGSLGLLSMEERANMLGGTLEIASRPGAGTTVSARIPLQPDMEPAA
ncbi:MAG TPA: PAS domain S-box protein [Burkholderiales bacterium]|nr:PAS domain S-box protein [Burkholderiales bacterium]